MSWPHSRSRERVPGDERLELDDEVGVAAEREIRLDPIFEGGQPELLEPGDLAPRKVFVGEVGEGRASPERERLAESSGGRLSGPVGDRAPAIGEQLLEALGIELARLDSEHVARRLGYEHLAAQRPPEVGDVPLDDLAGGRRRIAAPEPLDQPVGRHDLVPVQQQDREQGALLAAAEGDRPAALGNLQGPKDAVFHTSSRGRRYHGLTCEYTRSPGRVYRSLTRLDRPLGGGA